jgi:hypothetical protein
VDLSVYDVIGLNIVTLAGSILNYYRLFGEWTDHMKLFHTAASLMLPNAFVVGDRRQDFNQQSAVFGDNSPADFFADALSGHYDSVYPRLRTEVAEDKIDNGTFYVTPFSTHATHKS